MTCRLVRAHLFALGDVHQYLSPGRRRCSCPALPQALVGLLRAALDEVLDLVGEALVAHRVCPSWFGRRPASGRSRRRDHSPLAGPATAVATPPSSMARLHRQRTDADEGASASNLVIRTATSVLGRDADRRGGPKPARSAVARDEAGPPQRGEDPDLHRHRCRRALP